MGCASSAQARGEGRRRSRAPYARTYSLPVANGEFSSHTVALRSSTLGSLALDRAPSAAAAAAAAAQEEEEEEEEEEIAKTSSDDPSNEADLRPGPTIELPRLRRLPPRTPTATPPRVPEVINAWELMEGLEDALRPSINRSFSFPTTRDPPKPGFSPLDPSDPILSELDPEILSSFRDALQNPSSPPPFSTKREVPKSPGIVRARIAAFQERIDARRARRGNTPNSAKVSPASARSRPPAPGFERRVVLYLTTLRGVRRTHEDCCAARAILRSYGARVDERDVSMHGGFKEELRGLLVGEKSFAGKLPRVFVDGEYLGGAEEVRRMHEEGELGRLLGRCDAAAAAAEGAKGGGACAGCGDVRFVPCCTCSGSCKVYAEEEEEEEEEEAAWGFRRCPDCNENGLVRCPLCC